jgi:outer membrane receptor protein involved in Fe transport
MVTERALISSQTIEPTQVAGFNQFFEDGEGTDSQRYGIAIDQKFSADIFGGMEYSMRDLKVPFTDDEDIMTLDESTLPSRSLIVDWREQMGRAYLYWTPHRWLALSSEYQYERYDGNEESYQAEEVTTHSFPLGINFHHPSGFSTRMKATYIDQEGDFFPQGSEKGTFLPGSDEFWTVDASISYRQPKRFGVITIGVKNLFDKSFEYQDMDPVRNNLVIQPERLTYARFTLAL